MSISFGPSRKRREFLADDNDIATLATLKKTRQLPPPHGFSLQGCSGNKVGLVIAFRDMFPTLDQKTIEAVLNCCGDDVELAVAKLEELKLTGQASDSNGTSSNPLTATQTLSESTVQRKDKITEDWLDPMLRDLYNSRNPEDSKCRLRKMLHAFEDAAIENYKFNSQEMKNFTKVFAATVNQNGELSRQLAIKEAECKVHAEQRVKDENSLQQANERIRSLEMTNYALSLHLRTALGSNSNDPKPSPDIF